ncbi:hypothetical protein [Candidatus Chrysopegis kryptomonas]|jgi:hypothetical protein|uniref:Uncharacterized protein n=1 Tax=Candidatus Chryseopegocella kryptomonas TaxID=1633643 RepID=A0A0P1MYN0_9BACT|nr:hypothetical protein [Candidatus Chrysopegis kryptomonas]CUT01066.1 hypothetical protein JGI23_00977 [Candidatus Chrysopegis kryptomonas]
MIILGKILQALGIAETMIGLIAGLQGSMRNEMLFAGIGIVMFIIGRFVEKIGWRRKLQDKSSS